VTLATIRETKLAREIGSPNANRCSIELEPEQIRCNLRRAYEVISPEKTMIALAVEQRGQPTLDRDEPVRVGADRHPAGGAAQLSACVKGRVSHARLVVGGLLSAEAETNRVEARARICDTGVA